MINATYNIYVRENTSEDKVKIAEGLTSPNISIDPEEFDLEFGKSYLFSIGAVKNGIEKVSVEKSILCGELWSPDYSLAKIYLDADDVSGEINSRVSNWVDRKTGESFTQIADSDKPILTTLNGRNALYFDASNENKLLENKSVTINSMVNNKSVLWAFAVVQREVNSNVTSQNVIGFYDSGYRFSLYTGVSVSGYTNKYAIGGRRLPSDSFDFAPSTISSNIGEIAIIYGIIPYSTKNALIYVDGSQAGSNTLGFTNGNTHNTNTSTTYIGGVGTFKGKISAIVFGNEILSDLERQKLEGWAAHKYGLTSNLPSNHPYKNKAPISNTKKPLISNVNLDFFDLSFDIETINGDVNNQLKYYYSNSPMDIESLPTPNNILSVFAPTYKATIDPYLHHYIRIGLVKNGYEKISDELHFYNNRLWTPDNLTNKAKFWLTAENVVVDSSKRISTANDITGNGYTFIQTNNAYMPLLQTHPDFNKPVFKFDGGDDHLLSTTTSAKTLSKNINKLWSGVLFRRVGDDVGTRGILRFPVGTGAGGRYAVYATTGGLAEAGLGTRRLDSDSPINSFYTTRAVGDEWIIGIFYHDYSTATSTIILNGERFIQENTGTTGNTSNTNSYYDISFGIENYTSMNGAFDGYIAEFMQGNTSLTEKDMERITGWFAHKYKLTNLLPANHPYKTLYPTFDIIKPTIKNITYSETSAIIEWGKLYNYDWIESINYYRYSEPTEINNLPEPIAILGGNVTAYEDTDANTNVKFYIRMGVVKDGVEKISDEVNGGMDIHWDKVTSLLHFNGDNNSTSFTDEKGNVWSRMGSPVISTEQSKFGGSSAKFSKNNYIQTENKANFIIGATEDFTVEAWLYIPTGASVFDYELPILCVGHQDVSNIGGGWNLCLFDEANAYIRLERDGTNGVATEIRSYIGVVPRDTWMHIEVGRKDGVVYGFFQGTLINTSTSFNNMSFENPNATRVCIGSGNGRVLPNNWHLDGFVDEFRLTRGVCRHTESFTPSSLQYTHGE